jgi:hypothetical protein
LLRIIEECAEFFWLKKLEEGEGSPGMVVWLMPFTIPGPTTNRIIILGISLEIYSLKNVESSWRTLVRRLRCCWCATQGSFVRHGSYEKYLYDELIPILRVRCRGCGRTHSLIPCFSVPGSSVGSAELHRYLCRRAAGVSRSTASQQLVNRGLNEGYGRRLDRRLAIVVAQGKALWPGAADLRARGLAWIISLVGATDEPVVELNRYALEHGVNGLWYSRRPVSVRRRRSVGSSGFT